MGAGEGIDGGSRTRVVAASPHEHWIGLFTLLRLLATAVAVLLLIVHRVTVDDGTLTVVVGAYGTATTLAVWRSGRLQRSLLWWAADAVCVLLLVIASGDWRSPVYLLALTCLILPATTLPPARAIGWTALFTAGYFAAAVDTGVDWETVDSTARLESFSTHLLLPLLLGVGLAYAARLLRRLDAERERSEQLVLEAERRRIARELHDSAKQRVHAAQLVLTALRRRGGGLPREELELAIRELDVAATELGESVADLRRPPDADQVDQALRRRAAQLEAIAGIPVRVEGEVPRLSPAVGTHVLHVVTEAMTNAVRHAHAGAVDVSVVAGGGLLTATVSDDGSGFVPGASPGAGGLRTMVERTELVQGTLAIEDRDGGGTTVRLELPLGPDGGEPR